MSEQHQQWLKDKFSEQHDRLLPIVAVADMLFGCNQASQANQNNITIPYMIVSLDRQVLADKLKACLKGQSIDSNLVLSYGLVGCFHEQLKNLSADDRKAKQKLVTQAIKSLSKIEKQKSFTQCVTDQAVDYLQ
jgi:hypothetical protein